MLPNVVVVVSDDFVLIVIVVCSSSSSSCCCCRCWCCCYFCCCLFWLIRNYRPNPKELFNLSDSTENTLQSEHLQLFMMFKLRFIHHRQSDCNRNTTTTRKNVISSAVFPLTPIETVPCVLFQWNKIVLHTTFTERDNNRRIPSTIKRHW